MTAERGRVSVDGCNLDGGFEVIDESPDLIELCHRNGSSPRPDLAAAGWEADRYGSKVYSYRQTFEKRFAEREGHVLAIAHPMLGRTLGFAELGNVSQSCRWLPASEVEPATSGAVLPA